ncbi:MAG: hypothetical protein ACI8RZ_003508, partial [Myxococcota bacterium]
GALMRLSTLTLLLMTTACDPKEDTPEDTAPVLDTATGDTDTDTDTEPECDDADSDGVCDEDDQCVGDDATGDTDGDGDCDDTDTDDDSDGVEDSADSDPVDPFVCGDTDKDSCEDCISGVSDPAADGEDWDGDGLCDAGDLDDDSDGVSDDLDSDPFDPYLCGDTDKDTCEDCISGVSDPAADGDDWDGDGLCDAVDPETFEFSKSQTIDSHTITCASVTTTGTYTECADLQVDGMYFPNGINCGPNWSTYESPYTSHSDFCELLTGSRLFEVYYTCDSTRTRVTYASGTWDTYEDNGYTQHIRCFY